MRGGPLVLRTRYELLSGCPKPGWKGWFTGVFFLWFVTFAYYQLFLLSGIPPLYSYLIVICVGIGLLLMKGGVPNVAVFGPFYGWFFLHAFYLLLGLLYGVQSEDSLDLLFTALEATLIGGVFLFLFTSTGAARLVGRLSLFALLLGIALVLFDFSSDTFTSVPGRAGGLYENPTIAALYLSLLMVPGVLAIKRALRLPLVALVGGAVIITFSRGGWLLWLSALMMMLYYGWIGSVRSTVFKISLPLILAGSAGVFVFSGAALDLVKEYGLDSGLTSDVVARLSGTVQDSSSVTRMDLLVDALGGWLARPVFGHGLGYTLVWEHAQRPHSMYALYLVEGGVFGLAILMSFFFLLWRTGLPLLRILALQLGVASFFTHNNFEQPGVLIIVSALLAHAYSEKGAHHIV